MVRDVVGAGGDAGDGTGGAATGGSYSAADAAYYSGGEVAGAERGPWTPGADVVYTGVVGDGVEATVRDVVGGRPVGDDGVGCVAADGVPGSAVVYDVVYSVTVGDDVGESVVDEGVAADVHDVVGGGAGRARDRYDVVDV